MATYSGNISFGLPNNTDCDQLLIYTATTESGSYSLESTEEYKYPTQSIEYVIDDTNWYKVAFSYSVDGYLTPLSDAVSGSGYLESRPSLNLTDNSDGVAFASIDDVYRKTHLTEDNVSRTEVEYSITVARAYIDNLMSTNGLDRYNYVWKDSAARRKYNAKLKLSKEVEINFAASIIYKNLADDAILANTITNKKTSSSVSVGQTSLGGITGADSIDTATYLDSLSQRYANYATGILNMILPTYVPLRYNEISTGNGFVSYIQGNPTFNFSEGLILDRMSL